MKRIGLVIAVLLLTLQTATGQTAKAVLDKVATVVNHTGGVTAAFQISSAKVNASGTMALKGQKFQVTTPHGITWFDGKTQWTYVKQNEEGNVSTPTAAIEMIRKAPQIESQSSFLYRSDHLNRSATPTSLISAMMFLCCFIWSGPTSRRAAEWIAGQSRPLGLQCRANALL